MSLSSDMMDPVRENAGDHHALLDPALAPRSSAREAAYAALDSERDYQDRLERNEIKEQRPMEQLALISKIVRDAEDYWYSRPGHLPMDFARKIGGVAVRMLEEHGAPLRSVIG